MSDKKEQALTPMTAGEMLMNARTNGRRKRELVTIARQLCIKEEFLEALEQGNYKEIPEVVYMLGFARNYAMEVGLDPDVVVKQIKKELGILKNPIPEKEGEEGGEVPSATSPATLHRKKSDPRALKNTAMFTRKHWKWLLGTVVLLGIIVTVVAIALSHGAKEDALVPTDVPVAAPAVPVIVPEYTVPVREAFGTPGPSVQVIFQATAETWLKVEDSKGETLFSRVLSVGDVYYVPAGETFATVGNAGGLDVWINGKAAPKLGQKGVKRTEISLIPDVLMPN